MKNKVCLVTGASRGIGKSIVGRLLKSGATVCATSREIEDLQALKVEFLKHQKNLHIFAADLSNRIEVDDLCDNVTKTVGNIDVLINNAGILILEPLSECSEELLRVSFEVNVFAPFALTRHFSKAMIEKKNGFNHKRVFFKFIYWWRRTKTLHLFCNKARFAGFFESLR